MLVGGLEHIKDARTLEVGGAAATAIEIAADGAGDTVFVYLADVDEDFAVLGASVIPLLEEFLHARYMGTEASGPLEAVESSGQIFRWQIRTH